MHGLQSLISACSQACTVALQIDPHQRQCAMAVTCQLKIMGATAVMH